VVGGWCFGAVDPFGSLRFPFRVWLRFGTEPAGGEREPIRLNARKMFGTGTAVVTASLALAAGAARAENPPPVAGCGNGFTLVFNPAAEALVAAATQGNVNGDGWICRNSAPRDNSNGHVGFSVVIDNTVPLGA
jgi:hypothetical protein